MDKEKQRAKSIVEETRDKLYVCNQLSLTPVLSYGPFTLGTHINQYSGLLSPDPFGETLDCSSYIVKDLDYYVTLWCSETKYVETINCQDHCYYQGVDLIGMSIFAFMSLIAIEPNKVEIEWTPGINPSKKMGKINMSIIFR